MSFLQDITSEHVIKGIIVLVIAGLLLFWGLSGADPEDFWSPIVALVLGTYFFRRDPDEVR